MKKFIACTLPVLLVLVLLPARADAKARFGLRAGVGTDISFGLAYGAGANFLIPTQSQHHFELGVMMFGGKFTEDSNNGFNDYTEKTSVFVFAGLANFLLNYTPGQAGGFFMAGMGLGFASIDWEESSPTDTSLGPPLPGGGSIDEESGTTGGLLFNIGGGFTFNNPVDLRLEIPIMIVFSAPGEASSVVPLFVLTAGYRFP